MITVEHLSEVMEAAVTTADIETMQLYPDTFEASAEERDRFKMEALKAFVNQQILEAKHEGWVTRDKETGTYYEVGWDSEDDEGNEVWHCDHTTTSYNKAYNTASRWGCDFRTIRTNPYLTN